MKHFFTLVTLAALLISIQSCSKEKRLERMIYTNDGNWSITTMTYTLVATDENNTVVTLAATLENAGTFDFEKDGSGSYNFTIDGVNHAQSFGWSNSDESVSITRISQDIDFTTGDIEQLAIAFGG